MQSLLRTPWLLKVRFCCGTDKLGTSVRGLRHGEEKAVLPQPSGTSLV